MQLERLLTVGCLSLLVTLSLTSCGTQDKVQPQPEASPTIESSGTRGQLISIQSDNVRAAGYDAGSMVMTVQLIMATHMNILEFL